MASALRVVFSRANQRLGLHFPSEDDMGKKTLIIVLLACVLGMGFAQQRAKKQGPADFTKVLESVRASWAEERSSSARDTSALRPRPASRRS